mgnify:CR=1 FL=1|jgi:hypothetical protein|tara:strand:+ start:538 stop:864 length:327 start_codon:yes stop_codon:yes gene_type:complete
MGYQTAQALALMDKMNLEQQIKNHLLGNFYPRHDVRLVPIAVQALEIYRDNIDEIDDGYFDVWDTYIELPEEIEFRNSNKISVGQCIESLRLDAWIDMYYADMHLEEE